MPLVDAWVIDAWVIGAWVIGIRVHFTGVVNCTFTPVNTAVQTCQTHPLAWSEFVHGPNLVSELCQSLLGPRNAKFEPL